MKAGTITSIALSCLLGVWLMQAQQSKSVTEKTPRIEYSVTCGEGAAAQSSGEIAAEFRVDGFEKEVYSFQKGVPYPPQQMMQKRGQAGWELVVIHGGENLAGEAEVQGKGRCFYFKRPAR